MYLTAQHAWLPECNRVMNSAWPVEPHVALHVTARREGAVYHIMNETSWL